MKKLLLFIPLLLISCGTPKTVYVPVTTIKTEIQTVHDTTVQVRLDVIRDSVTTKDTLSELSNKYAYSSAIWSGGMLSHTLGIKDVSTPVKVQYVTNTVKDSIQIPYKVVEAKSVNVLTSWQKFQIKWFWCLTAALVGYFAWTKRKYLIGLIKLI